MRKVLATLLLSAAMLAMTIPTTPAQPKSTRLSVAASTYNDREDMLLLHDHAARARVTTTSVVASTTTTRPPVAPPSPRPAAPTHAALSGAVVHSTGYCLSGRMANGNNVHDGAVAMNGVPLGTRYRILDGPLANKAVVVEDRIGSGSEFDVWFSSCNAALAYGRHTIHIARF